MQYYKDFDFNGFWKDDEYSLANYVEEPPSDELILEIEQELGYKLPQSYVALMKQHNGGLTHKTCYPMTGHTGWADDHTAIRGIKGIGRIKIYSLCGQAGSQYMINEWGYPQIGVMICDTPAGGHTIIMLDYRKCGKDGEPEVVLVDEEDNYSINFVAKDFETFVRGLVTPDNFTLD